MGGRGTASLGEVTAREGKNDASVGAAEPSAFWKQLVSLLQGDIGMASDDCFGGTACGTSSSFNLQSCDTSPILLSLPNLSEKVFTSETFPFSPMFNFGS